MRDQYLSLERNGIWSLVPPPPKRKHIGCEWVVKVKESPNGTIHKYKARLVAKAFHEMVGSISRKPLAQLLNPLL